MKHRALFLIFSAAFAAASAAAGADVETIVFLRHGERTAEEIGQLTAKGLNRSLALPEVLLGRFGVPQFIFAPDPARDLVGGHHGMPYSDYVRPLATIEPTAIRCGLPVNTSFGFKEIAGLERELLKPAYRNAVVFVSWEHHYEAMLAAKMIADLGGPAGEVPAWPSRDFDSLYVVRIRREGGKTSVSFTHDHEGLDGVSDRFPGPAATGPGGR